MSGSTLEKLRFLLTTAGAPLLIFAFASSAVPASTDQPSNWRTYSNTKFGFAFKYPAIESLSILTAPISRSDLGMDEDGACTNETCWAVSLPSLASAHVDDLFVALDERARFSISVSYMSPPSYRYSDMPHVAAKVGGKRAYVAPGCFDAVPKELHCENNQTTVPFMKGELLIDATKCSTAPHPDPDKCDLMSNDEKTTFKRLVSSFRFVKKKAAR